MYVVVWVRIRAWTTRLLFVLEVSRGMEGLTATPDIKLDKISVLLPIVYVDTGQQSWSGNRNRTSTGFADIYMYYNSYWLLIYRSRWFRSGLNSSWRCGSLYIFFFPYELQKWQWSVIQKTVKWQIGLQTLSCSGWIYISGALLRSTARYNLFQGCPWIRV